MQWPHTTAGYRAVLALVYAALAMNVVRLRRMNRAAFGDAGNAALRSAIRAHAHFAEYVPITALMIMMLEMSELPAFRVHLLMAALVLSRLMHPLGMCAGPTMLAFRIFRTGGMTLTITLVIVCAVMILLRLSR